MGRNVEKDFDDNSPKAIPPIHVLRKDRQNACRTPWDLSWRKADIAHLKVRAERIGSEHIRLG
jgi:hypothetical protein